jgi:tetratricopeptide (TPR) repeat protein
VEPPPDAGPGQAEQRRFLLFDAVARALARCGQDRPLVVVLEDLQWAGEASLRLLEHLAFELRDARVLLVVTLRDEPRERTHPVERVLSLLRRQSHGREIALRGFSRGEVAELLERTLGRRPPADLTSALYAHTEGVPLFVREAVRLLDERGDLRHPERVARQGIVLPTQSFDFIRRGLDALEPRTLTLVETASVLGRDFPLALAAAVAGVERGEALDRLDEAERAGVVEASPDAPATWRFVHALFREAAYEGISTARKARLHHAAAQRLEEQHREEPDAMVAELAHHLHESLAVGDPEHAYAVARRAAAKAQRLLAYEQAAIHLEQASTALEHFPSADPIQRLETWLALGEAYRCAGDRARRREVFGRALEAARSLDRPAELARAAIGLCDIAEWSVRDPVAEAALQETLDRLGEAPGPERARLLTRLAYQSILDERARPEGMAREAVAHARATGDVEALQEALYTLHFSIAGPDSLDERDALVRELLEVTPAGGALDTTVIALIDVASDRIELGDAVGARRLRAEAERVAGTRPHPGMVWHVRLFDAGTALMEGRFDEALRLTEEALLLGRRIGHPYTRPCYDAHRVGVARERGVHDEVVRLFAKGVNAERGATHYVRAVMGRSLAALGRADEAREHFDHLAAQDFAAIPRNIRWTDTMVETAHLCAELGEDDRAKTLADLLAPFEDHHGVLAVPVCYGGPVSFARARLLGRLGERSEAVELLEEARAAARGLGARPTQARIAIELGTLLARAGERSRSREHLGEALELARDLGLPEVEAAATERLDA